LLERDQGSKEKDGAVTNPWLSAAQVMVRKELDGEIIDDETEEQFLERVGLTAEQMLADALQEPPGRIEDDRLFLQR
ncbi:unnamed protein product, partial [Effrenium voratum]